MYSTFCKPTKLEACHLRKEARCALHTVPSQQYYITFNVYLERLTGGALLTFCCMIEDRAGAKSEPEMTDLSVGTEVVSSHSDFMASRLTAVTNHPNSIDKPIILSWLVMTDAIHQSSTAACCCLHRFRTSWTKCAGDLLDMGFPPHQPQLTMPDHVKSPCDVYEADIQRLILSDFKQLLKTALFQTVLV